MSLDESASELELPPLWQHAPLPLPNRRLFDNGLLRLLLAGLPEGREISITPGWPLLVTVAVGRLEIRGEAGRTILETGRHVRLEANVTHHLRAEGVTDLMLLLPLKRPAAPAIAPGADGWQHHSASAPHVLHPLVQSATAPKFVPVAGATL